MLHQARAHLTSAAMVVENDPTGAFVLAYDSARKTLAAILVNQGLRAGGDGAHAVLLDVVLAQLDPPLGGTFRPFSWMRPLRNHTEYPSPDYPVAQPVDVAEAIPAAAKMIDVATKGNRPDAHLLRPGTERRAPRPARNNRSIPGWVG